LAIFQKIDEDRAKNDKYGPNRKLPRLLGESELPDIYMNDDQPVEEENDEPTGRGARERTRVKYDDGLTEEQWLEAVDNSDDDLDEAIARKEAKLQRRLANKAKKLGEDVPSPVPSRESSEEPVPKKRGRKSKAEKRKHDEVSEDVEAAPRKRGRQSVAKLPDPLSSEERSKLQVVLNAVYDVVVELEEAADDDDVLSRDIMGMFLELPDRNDYPDYYQFIAKPIAMNQIKKKINKREYSSLKQFRQDIKQLCDNCRTYNEDGSVLYQDANLIEVSRSSFQLPWSDKACVLIVA
jgi:ATP-dependent helicase STH1/SNF2